MSEKQSNENPHQEDLKQKDQGRYAGAFFLIFIGIIFLLNTTGAVDWDIWLFLLRFWPVFIILAGIQVVFGKSRYATVANGILALVIFSTIAFVALAMNGVEYGGKRWYQQNLADRLSNVFLVEEGEKITNQGSIDGMQYPDADELKFTMNLGAGKFSLTDATTDSLFSYDENYFKNFGKINFDSDLDEGVLKIDYSQEKKARFMGVNTLVPEYNISFGNPGVPTSFDLDLGATDGSIELDEVPINKIDIDSGAGDLDIKFVENLLPSEKAEIKVGTGKVAIYIPEGTAYRVEFSVGVGSVKIIDQEYTKLGNEKEVISSDFQSAENKLDLKIDVGVGSFTLNYY